MLRFTLILLFLGFSISRLSAQSLVGMVQDVAGKPLSGVNVILAAKNGVEVLKFAITNNKGQFQILYKGKLSDSLELRASIVGYQQKASPLNIQPDFVYHFILMPQAIELPEVKVKVAPLWQNKDTLNYNVSAFKQPQDRVVGDIISRLPGIEVLPNGQIKYQGKPINKYYIEGLDLLDDKYGVANNNIPAESVEKIQVLENHQPLKVLDSITFTDRAAINIKLKSTAKNRLVGQGKIGISGTHVAGEAEVIGMAFKKTNQFINVYKFNNIGQDNSREILSQNIEDYINAVQNGAVKSDLLSLVQPPPPSLKTTRYQFNRLHTATVNQLTPLGTNTSLRINVDYLNDRQQQQSWAQTYYYYPSDTFKISEHIESVEHIRMFQSNMTIMANTSKYYLKNTLHYQRLVPEAESMLFNNKSLQQLLSNPFFIGSNEFQLTRASGKKIHEWKSYIGNVILPQSLKIKPGIYEDLFNGNEPYNELEQNVTLKNKYIHNYYAQRRKVGILNFKAQLGASYQDRQLSSNIEVIHGSTKKEVNGNFINDIDWTHFRIYGENEWTLQKSQFRLSVNLPISYNLIKYRDTTASFYHRISPFLFTPSMNIVVTISSRSTFQLFSKTERILGDITKVNRGYILRDYRTIINNNSTLYQATAISLSPNYTFKDPVRLLFFNAGFIFRRQNSDLLYDQQFKGNMQSFIAQEVANSSDQIIVNTRLGKYITSWKTNITGSVTYTNRLSDQILQGKLGKVRNNITQAGVIINSKVSKILTLDFSNNYSVASVQSSFSNNEYKMFAFNQLGTINFYPLPYLGLKIVSEYYYFKNLQNSAGNYFFGDILVHYKPSKSRVETELALNNLTNTKLFNAGTLSDNVQNITEYALRNRQLILRAFFRF